MTQQSGRDRRKDPRFDVKIKVDFSTKGIFVSNYVTNLSRGGVFIETATPLPIQSQIHLTFMLPDINVRIEATGKVVWTYDVKKGTGKVVSGMGIKFTDLLPQDKAQIEEYLMKLPPSSPSTP
ncbi:MAG TPA: TIGR02266 family protein [Nitrospiria bacterium]|nr:TIGR02266 family protein [Nitrospiria bacterium]